MQTETPLTVRQTAERLGISVFTVRAWIGQRRMEFLRLGRSIRISQQEVQRILDENLIPAHKDRRV
jgi:excisionase family DNA binding protein